MNVNLHTKGKYTSVLIIWYNRPGFQQKLTKHAKGEKETQTGETKQVSHWDSVVTEMLQLSKKKKKKKGV